MKYDHRKEYEEATILEEYMLQVKPYLDDQSITEICINKPGEIWTEGNTGWARHEAPFFDIDTCLRMARLIATHNLKDQGEHIPILSGSLPNGERVQVVSPPACLPGTVSFTIRKPSVIDKTLDELDAEGTFVEYKNVSDEIQPFEFELLKLKEERKIKGFLDLAVKKKRNILIVGKTGSGKTTITKSLTRSIPSEERLITIEDVHEVTLAHHANKVHLFFSREEESGGRAVVTSKQALAATLRMKPDRILLSELRGDEAWEFIKSINTGHPGSISTMHANGSLEAFEQLTALIKDSQTGAHLDSNYIKHRLFTTLDIVLFFHRRKLMEIFYDPNFKRQPVH